MSFAKTYSPSGNKALPSLLFQVSVSLISLQYHLNTMIMRSSSTGTKTRLMTFILLLFFNLLISQAKGNSNYRNRTLQDPVGTFYPETRHFYTTDSTLVINVNILLNQKADQFKITLGVSEEAENPKKSIESINKRIHDFMTRISILGIKKEDIFVDFISQTKIYDFNIESDQKIVTQKIKGFEIKKNMIINVNNYSLLEKIIYEASDFQIYDVIKFDYISTDPEKIKNKMLKEADAILKSKKEEYFSRFQKEIIGTPTADINFSYVFPKSQYQEYTAYESSDFDLLRGNFNSENYLKKLERKGKTFYYEGINYAGYDRVMNDHNPEIGIQYVLNVIVKYDLKKNK